MRAAVSACTRANSAACPALSSRDRKAWATSRASAARTASPATTMTTAPARLRRLSLILTLYMIRRAWERKANAIDRAGRTPYIAAMALRDIIILPDKRLRLVSEPAKKIDPELRLLVEDMFDTMYEAPGIGLAAIQIGVPRRVIVMDL